MRFPAPAEFSRPTVVALVDDDPEILRTLGWLVRSIGLETADYGSAADYLADGDERCGCVVCDVRLPFMSGLELLDCERTRPTPRPVILMSGFADVPLAVRAMRAGAFDFLLKPPNDHVLLERVLEAVRLDQTNRRRWAERDAARVRVADLSVREREVLAHVLDGLTNKEIARRLGLSVKTIEAHRAKIGQKLGTEHLPGLIRVALAAGLMADPVAEVGRSP